MFYNIIRKYNLALKFTVTLIINLISFMVIFSPGCQESDKIIIRYAHVGVPDEPQSAFADEVAKVVNEKTKGRIEIRLYPNSQLGNISELVDGVKYGFIGMSHHDFSSLSKFHRDLSVFNAPYIFRDVEHALHATNPQSSPILRKMNDELIGETGIRILGSFYRGTRQLTTSFPVYSVEDLKGKKIRGVPFPIWMSMLRGMGAIPTPVEFSELTTALMTGLVVGQENPLSNIYASKIYEVQSHITITNHMHSCLCVFIHEKLWQSISDFDKNIILEAISDASYNIANKILEDDERIKKELVRHGLIIIDSTNGLNMHSFKTSVLNQINKDFPEWKQYITDIESIN